MCIFVSDLTVVTVEESCLEEHTCTCMWLMYLYIICASEQELHVVASTLKPFISMTLYKNIHGFDVDATMYQFAHES